MLFTKRNCSFSFQTQRNIMQINHLGKDKMTEAAARPNTLVSRKRTILSNMAHECTDLTSWTSWRAEIP